MGIRDIRRFLNMKKFFKEILKIGKKCLINSEGDDSIKDWIKDHQDKLASPLNLEKIEAKNFSGDQLFIFFKNIL